MAQTTPAAGVTGASSSVLARLVDRVVAAPTYPARSGDRRVVAVAGLELPVRASVALAVVTFAVLLDHSRLLVPADLAAWGRAPEAMRAIAWERAVLFGLVPLLVVLAVFRDQPSRYGVTLGDWRAGFPLMLGGSALMTPIVLAFVQLPDAHAYYAPSVAPLGELLVTNVLDLATAEFAYRGFLMLALVRVIGPVGVLVAALPFVFAHTGKPLLEVFSTLGGGMAYGWLAWRTGSVVWGAIAHVYILTLAIVVAGGS